MWTKLLAAGYRRYHELVADGLNFVFCERCPNCESAYTGGHPDPDNRGWCIVCSDPKTGEIRGWVWRWTWLHHLLVMRHNIQKSDGGGP